MFCGMASSRPKPGKIEQLVAAALDHASALRGQPGCVGAYVLVEQQGRTQLSLSIFETEEAFQKAVAATRTVIARHHLEQLLDGPSEFRFFDVR